MQHRPHGSLFDTAASGSSALQLFQNILVLFLSPASVMPAALQISFIVILVSFDLAAIWMAHAESVIGLLLRPAL